MSETKAGTFPDQKTVEGMVRAFVATYVEENRSVTVTSAFDLAYGGCGPFAEALVEELRDKVPGIVVHDRDTQDMLANDADLPTPEDFEYALHVYVEVETDRGALFYDAVTPQGVPLPSWLSFNAEQIRFARACQTRESPDDTD